MQGKWDQQGEAAELGDFTIRHLGFERCLRWTPPPLPEAKEGGLEAEVKELVYRLVMAVATEETTTSVADTTAETAVCRQPM